MEKGRKRERGKRIKNSVSTILKLVLALSGLEYIQGGCFPD
jgi:hypothetical protein